jgi:glutamate--cysteine ligase
MLYEADCLLAAWDLVKGLSWEERLELARDVPRAALAARVKRYKVIDLARELLTIAEEGLRRQNLRDPNSATEAIYLEPLHEIVRDGRTRAERLLAAWARDPDHDPVKFVRVAAYRPAVTDRQRSAS